MPDAPPSLPCNQNVTTLLAQAPLQDLVDRDSGILVGSRVKVRISFRHLRALVTKNLLEHELGLTIHRHERRRAVPQVMEPEIHQACFPSHSIPDAAHVAGMPASIRF